MLFFWTFYSSIKCISFHKNIFNIDINQKYFLRSKSAYYYDFWRSCDTEDWSNDAGNYIDILLYMTIFY